MDPLALALELIRCPSVTPAEGGALSVLEQVLGALGFTCERMPFQAPGTPDIDNLYAHIGAPRGRQFCFAGHTDVVPVGDRSRWTVDPFAGVVDQGWLIGRGAADMKAAIACFVAAAERYLAGRTRPLPGGISLLITGDEEGPAINGTARMLEALRARGQRLDACLVGEPTNPHRLGEMAKIGRRGSLNGLLAVTGVEGHVAYPHLADNPLPRLVRLVGALLEIELDAGTAAFQPSNLELTAIDTGNPATNVIPRAATARFNIRFNDRHTGASLERRLRDALDRCGMAYHLEIQVSGEAFITQPGALSAMVAAAVADECGAPPAFSTSGGTSDARFIARACPVIEFGLVGESMHKVDEKVRVEDLERLTRIYVGVLERFFAAA